MGLFGFIGKAVKGVAHLVGSVAKVAAPLALGGPLGGAAGGILGSLLHSKAPMSSAPLKLNVLGRFTVPLVRGQSQHAVPGGLMTRPVLRASPVMPGGSIATAQGIMASGGGLPPSTFGGRKSSGHKRKRRSSSSRKSSRARSSRKRRSGGKRLKFGSAAYRKKYLGHR